MVKLYMILFWMQNTARIEIMDTDEELEKSLSQINMSKADLVIQDRTSVVGEYYNTRYKAITGALHIEKHEECTQEGNKLLRYLYWLEGSSVNDTLECLKNKKDPLTHIDFTQIEIEEAFKLLKAEGLIKPFAVHDGE